MLACRKGESFVGIMVGVFILSIVILGIVTMIIYTNELTEKYSERNHVQVLSQNLTRVIKKIDTSSLRQNEVFYIYKNPITKNYEAHSGSTYSHYRFIDENGNHISNTSTHQGDIYSQILWLSTEDTTITEQNQVIRASIQKLIRN